MKIYSWFVLFGAIVTGHSLGVAQEAPQHTLNVKPQLQHGINYQEVSDIKAYYISEKLDGVRAYWNGKQLLTRQGNLINTPDWFTQDWPEFPIDGELWIGRAKFQTLLSCVRKIKADENRATSCWKEVRFMMFDLPDHQGSFRLRVNTMQALLTQVPSPFFAMISQIKVDDNNALDELLNSTIAMQGEGLMLHLATAHYQIGRTTALMKLKKHQDAEAVVIGYTQGKGKYAQQVGAVKVQLSDGTQFKIGSGLSDKQRITPPAIGTVITFKYNGLTDAGVPRFARFWRIKVLEFGDSDQAHSAQKRINLVDK